MKTASSSGSPTERSSCCCVPSPQSNSSRSPPARSSSAGRPRRAEGTEPAVPAKKSERSIGAATLERVELHELELQPPAARRREPHRVPGRAPALGRRARVEDVEARPRARAAAGASGRTRPRRRPGSAAAAARAGRRPAPPSCVITIRAPSASTIRTAGSRIRTSGSSTLPCTACTGGPSDSSSASTSSATRSPACRIASAARSRSTHAAGSARAPLRHVRVADDRELQARQEGFEPPTSASGGQRSIH